MKRFNSIIVDKYPLIIKISQMYYYYRVWDMINVILRHFFTKILILVHFWASDSFHFCHTICIYSWQRNRKFDF